MNEKKQIHVDVSEKMFMEIKRICPEKGMISLLARKLFREFIKNMHDDKLPPDIDLAELTGSSIAERWKEEEEDYAAEGLTRSTNPHLE
jgi:hypothetical protein